MKILQTEREDAVTKLLLPAPIREDKTEVSSSIPESATHGQQGQQGGTSQHDTYRRHSKHVFHKAMNTKPFNNLSHISRVKNPVLMEQFQSYF